MVERALTTSPQATARISPEIRASLGIRAGGASTLFLSEATVKTHITHLLTKLNLRDRVQAVVLAYESGLVQAGDERGE